MAGTLLNNTIDKTDANQQLASTINQGGLLMRMAKNQGVQQVGSRGLMNSSIGSEASQRAIVAAAQPLALQNTQFAKSKDINQQQADLTAQRDAKQQDYNKENLGLQFGYNTRLNDQQNTFTAGEKRTKPRAADEPAKRCTGFHGGAKCAGSQPTDQSDQPAVSESIAVKQSAESVHDATGFHFVRL